MAQQSIEIDADNHWEARIPPHKHPKKSDEEMAAIKGVYERVTADRETTDAIERINPMSE